MSRYLTVFLVLTLACVSSHIARAQVCTTDFEVITTLRPPTFGFPTVWDARYGVRDGMIQLGSGVPYDDGTVMAMGRRLAKDDFKPEDVVLVELNRRGRALTEKKYPAKPAEEPVKMVEVDGGYVAVSNIRGGPKLEERHARLAWYGKSGDFRKDTVLKDDVFDYQATHILPATEGSGVVVVLHAINRSNYGDTNGVLMRVGNNGEVMWKRAYRPGIPNVLYHVYPVNETSYMAVGNIRLDDGRMAGWALKLGYDGAIQWQRTYPRGAFSEFRSVAVSGEQFTEGRGFVFAGASTPLDDGPDAAWIMEVDAVGEPLWQRYYRRPDAAMNGRWIEVEKDGRFVLIMNVTGASAGGGVNDHVRMLTLSPRGTILQDESYFEGRGAQATDYVRGWNGERILTTIIEEDTGQGHDEDTPIVVVGLVDDPQDAGGDDVDGVMEAAKKEKPVLQGWVFVATALDPYRDPCAEHAR